MRNLADPDTANWWPPAPELLDGEWIRVELTDHDDPDGTRRAQDHAIGWSAIIAFAAAAVIATVIPRLRADASVGAVVALAWLWLRAVASGVWLSRHGIRAVSFPCQVTVDWHDAEIGVQPTPFGPRLRITEPTGRSVTLSLTQLASGVVFGRSPAWRVDAVELLSTRLRETADRAGRPHGKVDP